MYEFVHISKKIQSLESEHLGSNPHGVKFYKSGLLNFCFYQFLDCLVLPLEKVSVFRSTSK